jgi:CRISPR-associated endonuclease Csn1
MKSQEMTWGYDLGKGSIGEVVRLKAAGKIEFPHKKVWLFPTDFARRGPATKAGTPASRYRAWKTRQSHKRREDWLDEIWEAAGLTALHGRQVAVVDGKWRLTQKGDLQLENEATGAKPEDCCSSSLLRVRLLRAGEKLAEWQVYKALRAAIQKRGYTSVPWERGSKPKENLTPEEKAAMEKGNARWTKFTGLPELKRLGKDFQLPCYYDAFHLGLWSPSTPDKDCTGNTNAIANENTRNVIFDGAAVEREVLLLAEKAVALFPQLHDGFRKVMDDYKQSVRHRVAEINARRALRNKAPLHIPLKGGAASFGALLAFGVGGQPDIAGDKRRIASWDRNIQKDMGLKPGSPQDHKAGLGQIVARFENRLRAECALIRRQPELPRLAVCRNPSREKIQNAKSDDDPCLLPAQFTFLSKLKNLWVEEFTAPHGQRKLYREEIRKIFAEQNPKRAYSLTPGQWRDWCGEFGVQPALDLKEKIEDAENTPGDSQEPKTKKKKAFVVDPPSTEGRSRFSRPALRILIKLILSGLKPSELRELLEKRDEQLLNELRLDILDAAPIEVVQENGREFKIFRKQPRTWLLISDLDFFSRMQSNEGQEDWDKFFIPSSNLDRLAAESNATETERKEAIEKLISQQNNPIVRHRLTAFWERLQGMEKKFGVPDRIVLELIRDDPENSWLGKDTVKEIIKFQDKNREDREKARKRLEELPQYKNEEPSETTLTKFILWEQQGGECLYGRQVKEAENVYLETGLPISNLEQFRIDHIVPRALGGPDSIHNKVLTDDDTNARKGDRTPFQWFHDDRIEQWQAFRDRVLKPNKKLGGKKIRLLLSANAEEMVQRYTPLAETAWIARVAQVVAGLHFGWVNGIDEKGKRRITRVSGGLTGRVRRQYSLNSLTGEHAGQPLPTDKEERKDWEVQSQAERATKDRTDKRHHALDAMVLTFLEEWMNDPEREAEFRFTDLGDSPAYLPKDQFQRKRLYDQIAQLQEEFKTCRTTGRREETQREITRCHDRLAQMRQKRNWRPIREFFEKQLKGTSSDGQPVIPVYRHYEKPRLEATLHRGTWMLEENSKARESTVENFDKAFKTEKVALSDLPYSGQKLFDLEHGRRRAAVIAPHKDYDAKVMRKIVQDFLRSNPTESDWKTFATTEQIPALIKPKKGEPDTRNILLYRLKEVRTKRVPVFETGLGKQSVAVFDPDHFDDQIARLVVKPERPKKGDKKNPAAVANSPTLPQPNTELQSSLRGLKPQIELFFRDHDPDMSEKSNAEEKALKSALSDFAKQHDLDKHLPFYLSKPQEKPTDAPWERKTWSQFLIRTEKRFSMSAAQKEAYAVVDPWIRVQLRHFYRTNPLPKEWRMFCDTFCQVKREHFKAFVTRPSHSAVDFIEFYQSAKKSGGGIQPITGVHKLIGNELEEYVDVSKDRTGQYAKGGNRGYFIYKRKRDREFVWRATPVRVFQSVKVIKEQLLANSEIEPLWEIEPGGKKLWRLWKTNMLFNLPQTIEAGSKVIEQGYYFLGSISCSDGKNDYITLNSPIGKKVPPKLIFHELMKAGLHYAPTD